MSQYQGRDKRYTRPGVADSDKFQPVLRGYTDDTEVLTEVGWVKFSDLYAAGVSGLRNGTPPLFGFEIDWTEEHRPLTEEWQTRRTRPFAFTQHQERDFTKWSVNPQFPRLATLASDPTKKQDGAIVFERPQFATRFTYENYQLVQLKKRGVDLLVPRFTDMVVKHKFQHGWKFVVADDLCNVRTVRGSFQSLVNRYTPPGALFGDVDAQKVLELSEYGELRALMEGSYPVRMRNNEDAKRVRIWDAYPYPKVRDEASGRFIKNPTLRNSVECFNFIFPALSSHTLIVRRQGYTTTGERPQTSWTGNPLLVGDGYDKSQTGLDRLK